MTRGAWLGVVVVMALGVVLLAVIGMASGPQYLTRIDEAGRICVQERDFFGEVLREVCK